MKTQRSPVSQTMLALLLVCMIANANCAVFYTQSRDNDYPRIGRRGFFTRINKGSSYPRVGRSSPGKENASGTGKGNDQVLDGYEDLFHSPLKRGFFTASAGKGTYPRVGRSGLAEVILDKSSELPAVNDLMTSMEVPGVSTSEESQSRNPFRLPLGLLFFSFDLNGDKTLTREEFVEGMHSARGVGTSC